MCVRTAALAGWHPPSLPTAPAKGIWTPKLSYQRPENGEHVKLCHHFRLRPSGELSLPQASGVAIESVQARASSESNRPIAIRGLFLVISSMIEQAHAVVDALAKRLELVGAAIILGGVVLGSVRFAVDGSRTN